LCPTLSFSLTPLPDPGFGLEPNEPVNEFCYKDLHLHRGWWEDLRYYTRCNHPVFLLFFADPLYPYSTPQRVMEFAGGFVTTFGGAGILLSTGSSNFVAVLFLSIVFITVPTVLFRKIAFVLFAAPCLIHDERKATGTCKTACLKSCEDMGALSGTIITIIWIVVFLTLGLIYWIPAGADADFTGNAPCLPFVLIRLTWPLY
jgi:hypothetical protein